MLFLHLYFYCFVFKFSLTLFFLSVVDKGFSPHFGIMIRPLKLGIFCDVLYKIGKISHHIMSSNKTKNDIFGSLISRFQNWQCKYTICCSTVQLRCHKHVIFFFFLEWEIFPLKLGKKHSFCIGNMTQYRSSKWTKKHPVDAFQIKTFSDEMTQTRPNIQTEIWIPKGCARLRRYEIVF